MKLKGFILSALLTSSIVLWAFYPNADPKEKESMILNAVVNYLESLHFDPLDINDDFSSQAFDNYLQYIDSGKRFLIQSEVDQLSVFKNQIDDQIEHRSLDFFDASLEIIDGSRERAQKVFDEIITMDLDAVNLATIQTDSDKRQFAQSEDELKQTWIKFIKHDYNSRLDNRIEQQNNRKEKEEKAAMEKKDMADDNKAKEDKEPFEYKTVEELKKEVVEKIKESYTEYFKRLNSDKRSDKFGTYVNALTHLYDPHSDYYSPKEKEDFDIRMGGKLEGIGARLQTEGDYTKVIAVIPGGPAWKGKVLEVDDLITAVKQKEEEPVDITGMRIEDVVSQIRGKKGTIVILTVKKVDGSTLDVEIERDEVIIDEGFARSLILDLDESIQNVGYIKLPKFYSSFEKKDGNSCARDVAKEIEKLKEENVNGIILDLRNNGGGSLQDVVDMTGLFIEEGPIVQVKPRDKTAYVYDDKDSNVQWDGPLVIMVNQFSASASEILAAALQDYNRAVIVGSTSTFGKGTVQRFVDLDRAYRDLDEIKPLGNLKITMQKFFRVNGGSTQLKGVIPDIILPNNYHFIDTGEKDYDHAMEWSEIKPVEYDQKVYQLPDMTMLQKLSKDRVSDKDDFQLVLENAARLKKNRDQTEYPLDFDALVALNNEREEAAEKFEDLFDEVIPSLKMKNLAADVEYINAEESRVSRNDDWKETISKDIYLEETMYILEDIKEHGHQISMADKK